MGILNADFGAAGTAQTVCHKCHHCGEDVKPSGEMVEISHFPSAISSSLRGSRVFHVDCFLEIAGKEQLPPLKPKGDLWSDYLIDDDLKEQVEKLQQQMKQQKQTKKHKDYYQKLYEEFDKKKFEEEKKKLYKVLEELNAKGVK